MLKLVKSTLKEVCTLDGGKLRRCWWFQPTWKVCSSNWIIFPKKSGARKVLVKLEFSRHKSGYTFFKKSNHLVNVVTILSLALPETTHHLGFPTTAARAAAVDLSLRIVAIPGDRFAPFWSFNFGSLGNTLGIHFLSICSVIIQIHSSTDVWRLQASVQGGTSRISKFDFCGNPQPQLLCFSSSLFLGFSRWSVYFQTI